MAAIDAAPTGAVVLAVQDSATSSAISTQTTQSMPGKSCSGPAFIEGGCPYTTRCVKVNIRPRTNDELPVKPNRFEKKWGGYYDAGPLFVTLTRAFFAMGALGIPDGQGNIPNDQRHVCMHLMNQGGSKELVRLDFEAYTNQHRLVMSVIEKFPGRYTRCLAEWATAWWYGYGEGPFTYWRPEINSPRHHTESCWQMHDRFWTPDMERKILKTWNLRSACYAAYDASGEEARVRSSERAHRHQSFDTRTAPVAGQS